MAVKAFTAALVGNPNVGKSTLFNALTHMRRHTGNWPGKSVDGAYGSFTAHGIEITLVDVPGAYSLNARSPDEQIAHDYICGKLHDAKRTAPDAAVVICDACSMRRSLRFADEIAKLGLPYILCINLADEARRRGISIDYAKLEELSGVPCVACCARDRDGTDTLTDRLCELLLKKGDGKVGTAEHSDVKMRKAPSADELYRRCVTCPLSYDRRDRAIDRILTGKILSLPICALLLALVFFITVKVSTPLSDALDLILSHVLSEVNGALSRLGVPFIVRDLLCGGILGVTFRVCSVMLPPMAIFFPLFTLLEDLGLLPRIAFIFDRAFASCGACGKQSLTMMMGLGCNAVGVTGCRIIDSPRERMIAVLTNSFTPCNGRLAVIISLAAALARLSEKDNTLVTTVTVFGAVMLSFLVTLGVSRLLSTSVLTGDNAPFTLELPPYRMPKLWELVVRSVLDRTVFVLGRALIAAAPAGLIIWILCNTRIGSVSLLSAVTSPLDPIGRAAGMDGVMMCAFILALPAAELTVPLMAVGYTGMALADGSEAILSEGFVGATLSVRQIVCAIIFTVIHFPCLTTLMTVRRETGKRKVALFAAILPSVLGYLMCVTAKLLFSLFA